MPIIDCVDCGMPFHLPPSHVGRYARCPDCRGAGGGKRHFDPKVYVCPGCGHFKRRLSRYCVRCFKVMQKGQSVYNPVSILDKLQDSPPSSTPA